MAITYSPTTNFGLKDSLPTNDSDKVIRGSEFTTEFTAIQTAFSLAAPSASPTFTGTVTIPTADINGGAIDGTTIGATTPAAASFTTVSATGNITVGGTVDGRDVAADGTKLDGIEAGADVTDTTNVTAAGALMDSELTDIAAVKALDQGVATTDSPSFAGLTATGSVSLAGASTTADITFGDNVSLRFGDEVNGDLVIKHDGTNSSIVDRGTGDLLIQGSTNVKLQNFTGSKDYFVGSNGGAATIYYDGSAKLATTAAGIDVTGTVTADGLTSDGVATVRVSGAGSTVEAFNVYNTDGGSNNSQVRLYLGASEYSTVGRGLRIDAGRDSGADGIATFYSVDQAEHSDYEAIKILTDGGVTLSHLGNNKLATTATGIDVTGVITTDGMTTSADITFGDNDKAIFGAGSDLQIYHDGSNSYVKDNGTGGLILEGTTSTQIKGSSFVILRSLDGENMAVGNANGSFDLYYDNVKKLATTNTGIDVTGTVTADGLTVDVGTVSGAYAVISNTEGTAKFGTDSNYARILDGSNNILMAQSNAESYYYNNGVKVIKTASGGDISFYEDTGTTPKFFWDASAEALGIGTSSPASGLELEGVGNATNVTLDNTTASTGRSYSIRSGNTGSLDFYDNDATTARVTINSSGNVGIGTSSPNAPLHIANAAPYIRLEDTSASVSHYINSSNTELRVQADSVLSLRTSGVEAARIDSSGNLLVGTTDATPYNNSSGTGLAISSAGQLSNATHQDAAMLLNRMSTDGSIIDFKKDGTTVGSIVAYSGDLVIGDDDIAIRFDTGAGLVPWDIGASATGGLARDAAIDIGVASARFKDLYLSGMANAGGLTVAASGASGIELDPDAAATTDSGRLFFSTSAGTNAIFGSSGNLRFTTGATAGASSGTERMRLDASGNLLVGTTSSSGVETNTARITGGRFSTHNGTQSVAHNTATTVATLPSGEGNYIVSASMVNSGAPATYNAVAVVGTSQSSAAITALNSTSAMTLSMSGLNLQVTQGQGTTQTIAFSILRLL